VTSFPHYYDPKRIGTLFYPDVAAVAEQAQNQHLMSALQDSKKIAFLIIDMQVDFSHGAGTLTVPGALADIRRVIEFIFNHAEKITKILCSLDSHYPLQIFHPAWWVDENGHHPPPFTIVSAQDVEKGKWSPLYSKDWSVHYVHELQNEAKKQLTIWPYHVPIGGVGHALDPELWSAVFWHSIARKSQPLMLTKGSLPNTEHYSVIKPEIETEESSDQSFDERFSQLVHEYDYIYLAGEAESHCVLETVKDLVRLFADQPQKLRKLFILDDCMSSVVHPDIDFHAIAREEFVKCAQQGVQFVKSTDPFVV